MKLAQCSHETHSKGRKREIKSPNQNGKLPGILSHPLPTSSLTSGLTRNPALRLKGTQKYVCGWNEWMSHTCHFWSQSSSTEKMLAVCIYPVFKSHGLCSKNREIAWILLLLLCIFLVSYYNSTHLPTKQMQTWLLLVMSEFCLHVLVHEDCITSRIHSWYTGPFSFCPC